MFNDSIVVLIMLSMICPSRFEARCVKKPRNSVLGEFFQASSSPESPPIEDTHKPGSCLTLHRFPAGPLVQLCPTWICTYIYTVIFARPIVPIVLRILLLSNRVYVHTCTCSYSHPQWDFPSHQRDDPTIGGWENQTHRTFCDTPVPNHPFQTHRSHPGLWWCFGCCMLGFPCKVAMFHGFVWKDRVPPKKNRPNQTCWVSNIFRHGQISGRWMGFMGDIIGMCRS